MTRQEFDNGYDGLHVPLTCENHPNLRWSCKRVAISFDKDGVGRYNQCRNIFFNGSVDHVRDRFDIPDMSEECDCPASKLRLILEDEKVA